MEILSVLRELLGEAIHIVTLNASSLGALLSKFIDWLKSHRKQKEITTELSTETVVILN